MCSTEAPLVNNTSSPETFTFSPSSRYLAFSKDNREKTCQGSHLSPVSTMRL